MYPQRALTAAVNDSAWLGLRLRRTGFGDADTNSDAPSSPAASHIGGTPIGLAPSPEPAVSTIDGTPAHLTPFAMASTPSAHPAASTTGGTHPAAGTSGSA